MDKPFLTYEQMLNKLSDEKGLTIKDRDSAIALLKENSYFSLVCGYKRPFKDKSGNYKKNVTFEDIYRLYDFDNELRLLFLTYVLKVENHVKSLISYAFCSTYGAEQSDYLNATNYDYIGSNQNKINLLLDVLTKLSDSRGEYPYIDHQREKHGNVPLWVIMKALTLGKVSKMYSCLKSSVQTKISIEFPGINEHDLSRILDYITRIRNVCAHNERLFDFRYNKGQIMDTDIHAILGIKKKSTYTKGKNDLFAAVIILKLLLNERDFSDFYHLLNRLIDNLYREMSSVPRSQLYKYMGFPENWGEISEL